MWFSNHLLEQTNGLPCIKDMSKKLEVPSNELRLNLTDDEKEEVFEEAEIIDTDGIENNKELLEDFLDDGFILNI